MYIKNGFSLDFQGSKIIGNLDDQSDFLPKLNFKLSEKVFQLYLRNFFFLKLKFILCKISFFDDDDVTGVLFTECGSFFLFLFFCCCYQTLFQLVCDIAVKMRLPFSEMKFFWFGAIQKTQNVFPIFDCVSPKRLKPFFFWVEVKSKRRYRQLKLIAFKAKSKNVFIFLGNLFRFGILYLPYVQKTL